MGIITANIDDLLDATTDIGDEDLSYMLNLVEIDSLLDKTNNW